VEISDTIVAPATPAGEGGIGIVRVSGPAGEACLEKFFHPHRPVSSLKSHRLYYGRFRSSDGKIIDEVMAVIMRRPNSYTREDVVEIHCHGGTLVTRRILDELIDDGLRLARPGEFTLRAFMNGRLDLTQAEAVIDVIRSRSDAARHIALGQLEGRLSTLIGGYREDIADLLARIEAQIDFPEEDIPESDQALFAHICKQVIDQIDGLLATFDSGRVMREGISVLILGRPNVGKSSLMNTLIGEARAIVTPVAGTTRDTIEEGLCLGGLPLRLVDAAGVRHTEDPVEAEGVRRARHKASTADLVLLVVDGGRPPDEDDLLALESARDTAVLLVVNKCDLETIPLPAPFGELPQVRVSAHTGAGIEALKERIVSIFVGSDGDSRESILLSDRRHRQALLRAREALQRFIEAQTQEYSLEFMALDLKEALQALGEITGETTPDDILERIFTRFCIGK